MITGFRKQLYERYHTTTSIQKYLIKKNNFTYRIILEIITKFLNSPKDILDIGSGAGTLSLYFASKNNRILGIDISKKAIESCARSSKILGLEHNVDFKVMNFPNEIPNKKFDFIICSEVIEHLENDDLALRKIFSLLKPEGIAIISTPSKNAPLYRLGLANKFDREVGHLRRYFLEELVKKCKKANFKILETRKTEGVLRNFLFINPVAGKTVRFIKFFISDVVTFFDNISLKLFGESQIFVIVQKPHKVAGE